MACVQPFFPSIVAVLLSVSSTFASATWLSSVDEALACARVETKLVFLEIVSPAHPPSIRRDRDVYSDPRLASLLDSFVLARLDDSRSHAAAEKWRPAGYPTLVVLQADGVEIARPLGSLDAGGLAERLAEILADERALVTLQERLAVEPGHSASQLALARIYLRRGNGAAAQPLIESLSKAADENVRAALPSLWMNLGMVLGKGGPSPKGIECFERVTKEFPQSREAEQAYFMLHMGYLMRGDRELAVRALAKVLELSRDDYLRERAEHALRRLQK